MVAIDGPVVAVVDAVDGERAVVGELVGLVVKAEVVVPVEPAVVVRLVVLVQVEAGAGAVVEFVEVPGMLGAAAVVVGMTVVDLAADSETGHRSVLEEPGLETSVEAAVSAVAVAVVDFGNFVVVVVVEVAAEQVAVVLKTTEPDFLDSPDNWQFLVLGPENSAMSMAVPGLGNFGSAVFELRMDSVQMETTGLTVAIAVGAGAGAGAVAALIVAAIGVRILGMTPDLPAAESKRTSTAETQTESCPVVQKPEELIVVLIA